MSFETHIFSSAKEACSYIACRSPSGDNPFASVSLVVPTQALKHRIMQTMSSLSVHVFSINEYVHDIIYSANKHPFFESPIFSILIRNVIDALSREGFTSIQELEKTLDQFEHGYEGLVDSVRALLAAGMNDSNEFAIRDFLRAYGAQEHHKIEADRALSVVTITKVMYDVLIRGLGVIGKQNREDFNFGIREGAILQAAHLISKGASLPSEHVVFYGFSNFTGVQNSLFETIVEYAARVELLIVSTRDLAIVEKPVLDTSYEIINRNLFEKISIEPQRHLHTGELGFPEISFSYALGYKSELRHVFQEVRSLLLEGVVPDEIILIAPSWEKYKPFLRAESERLNIPIEMTNPLQFSTPKMRLMESFIQLLSVKDRYPLSSVLSLFSFDILQKKYEHLVLEKKRIKEQCLLTDDEIIQSDIVLLEDIQLYFQAFGLVDLEDLEEKQLVLENTWNEAKSESTSIPALIQMRRDIKKGVDVYQASRRKIPIEFLRYITSQCLSLLVLLNKLQGSVEDGSFIEVVEQICRILGWSKISEETIALYAGLERIKMILEVYEELTYRDFLSLLGKEMGRFGVQVLGQNEEEEARIILMNLAESGGYFAEHIFFLGLNKGELPSVFVSDPLLTEEIRSEMREFLPALRDRTESYLEERLRLYSLISASNHAYLSWITTDEMGQACSVSPLVRRLLLAHPEEKIITARSLSERVSHDEPQTLRDRIVLSGIHGDSVAYHHSFLLHAQRAWKNLYMDCTKEEAEQRIHRSVLGRFQGIEELYPPVFSEVNKRIGPLGGLTGLGPLSGALPEDPFALPKELPSILHLDHSNFITRVEQYFSCPWRNFLARLLRVQHTDNPQKTLPKLNQSTLGNIVHNALEDLVNGQRPEASLKTDQLENALPPVVFPVVWSDSVLSQYAFEQSKKQMFLDQQLWPRAADVAFNVVNPYFEVEQALEFSSEVQCLGAELEGDGYVFAHAEGGLIGEDKNLGMLDIWAGSSASIVIRVLFKADRVDVDVERGLLSLLDYKTGKMPGNKTQQEEKRKILLSEMKKGKKLQPVAYISSLHVLKKQWPDLKEARGTLLYLKPDPNVSLSMRDFSLDQEDEEGISVFSRVLWASATGQALGVNFPRLTQRKGRSPHSSNEWCKHCDFQRACRFNDSGFRRRLIQACSVNTEDEIPQEEPGENIEERMKRWRAFLTKKVWNIGEVK